MKFNVIIAFLCVIFIVNTTALATKKQITCKNPLLNKILIQMRKEKSIHFSKIEQTFCQVDRNDFLRKKQNYGIEAIYIGHGATLSMADGHMFSLEKSYEKFRDTKKALKILDIGSGSGIM